MSNKHDTEQNELTFGKMLFKGSFIFNPVLTQAIGLCPIAAIAYSVKPAAVLSLTLAALLLINELLAGLVIHKLPRWLRVCCYLVLSTAVLSALIPLYDIANSQLSAAMGIYLPLLAVNSLVVVRCEKFAVNSTNRRSAKQATMLCLFDALSASIGYAAVILLTALIREQLTTGTVFGHEFQYAPKISAMAMPFGGLIVLGFLAAVHKQIVNRFFPNEPVETFDFSKALKKPLLIDPGLYATSGSAKLMDEPFTEKDKQRRTMEQDAVQDAGDSEPEKTAVKPNSEVDMASAAAAEVMSDIPPDIIYEPLHQPLTEETQQQQPEISTPENGYKYDDDDPFNDYSQEADGNYKQNVPETDDSDIYVAIPTEENVRPLNAEVEGISDRSNSRSDKEVQE